MWRADLLRTLFTLYSEMGASKIDKIYTTKELSDKNLGVDTVAAAFTDHLSVVMRPTADVPIVKWGKGFWKINTFIINEEVLKRSCAKSGRFGGSRQGSTQIGPCGGESIQKTDSYFLYSGRVRTSAGLRENGEFPVRVYL